MEAVVEVNNVFSTCRYEVWENHKLLCHNAVKLWATGAVSVVGPAGNNCSVDPNDVVVSYHHFCKAVVQVCSVPTLDKYTLVEGGYAIGYVMVCGASEPGNVLPDDTLL